MLVKEISLKNNDFSMWDDERIKNAFNFGKGTKKDFLNYLENNKHLAKFEIIQN